MKVIRKRPAARPEAQAREWFVRVLDGDLDEDELLAWSKWLEASPANREAYEQVENAWALLGEVDAARPTDKQIIDDRYCPTAPVAHWRRAERIRKGLMWSAAPVAAAVLVSAFVWVSRDSGAEPPMTLATARAEDLQTKLPDGSDVHLGAMTTLQVAYRARARSIELLQGEALFQVARDPSRPFIVSTPLGTVTALGTAFDVGVQHEAVTLKVTEGVVSVTPLAGDKAGKPASNDGVALQVAAGERVRLRKTGVRLSVMHDTSPLPPTWTEGRLEYRDEPLRSVVNDVNRYATRPIVIQDPSVGELTYTGAIELEETDDWVKGLSAAFPVTVELNDQQQFVLKKNHGEV